MKLEAIATDVDERRREYFEHSKHTNGKDFMNYRYDVMTESERKLADDILRNFREAYNAKESAGVFEDMAIAEAYWSGDFDNKTTDVNANTNIINANIETQVADMLDQNIDIEPKAYEPTDLPYIPLARKIFDRIIDANKMPIKMERIVRRMKKFGSSWIRAMFNPDMLDGFGCPEITSVSTANVFPDASVVTVEDIHKGRYFIETITASIYWAEQTFGIRKASAIYPGFKPYQDTLDKLNSDDIDTTGENYLHLLYWCKYKDEQTGKFKLRLIQASGCGVILQDSLVYENEKGVNVFPNIDEFRYPYWVTNDLERENSVWGKSIASLLYPTQDLIDDLDNSILANARLTGNPIKLVLANSGIEADHIDNSEGQVIVSNVPNGVSHVAPPSMPQYIISRRDSALQAERIIVSRVSDQQAGIKQHGVDTATESLALQQNAMKAIDATKTTLQLVLADIFMYCFQLALEYWDADMFFQADEKDKFIHFNPTMLNKIPVLEPASEEYIKAFKAKHKDKEAPEYMEVKDKFRKIRVMLSVSVGAGLPKNKALMYNIIKETYMNKAMGMEEYREKLDEYVGLPKPTEEETMAMQQPAQQPTNAVQIPFNQSRDVFAGGGVNAGALDRIQQQRTGGNYNAIK